MRTIVLEHDLIDHPSNMSIYCRLQRTMQPLCKNVIRSSTAGTQLEGRFALPALHACLSHSLPTPWQSCCATGGLQQCARYVGNAIRAFHWWHMLQASSASPAPAAAQHAGHGTPATKSVRSD